MHTYLINESIYVITTQIFNTYTGVIFVHSDNNQSYASNFSSSVPLSLSTSIFQSLILGIICHIFSLSTTSKLTWDKVFAS